MVPVDRELELDHLDLAEVDLFGCPVSCSLGVVVDLGQNSAQVVMPGLAEVVEAYWYLLARPADEMCQDRS